MSMLVKMYYHLVKNSAKELEDVPEKIRAEVEELLQNE